jgi:predicted ATPase with chaperone activity
MEAEITADEILDPWQYVPLVPTNIKETGIPEAFLRELVLKTVWAHDVPSLGQIATVTGLHSRVVEELVLGLNREGLFEADSGSAGGSVQLKYRLSEKGKNAAHEALSRSRYVGVAPVPVSTYNEVVAEQVRRFKRPPLDEIKKALEHMVIPERLIEVIGQAFFSRRALMIYGPSGNGKTDIVTSIAAIVAGTVVIPYALYGHGQLIRVFDPDVHKSQVGGEKSTEGLFADKSAKHDRRWLPVSRPNVIVGGDMGAEALEMTYDATQGIHQAPLSVIAQGGVLVIDDLGRQKVSPKEILNRWVIMMEQGYDSFALSSSEIVRLPLDVTLIFSTNLTLRDLMDEAYLRRIAYKIAIPDPTREQLAEITRRYCTKKQLPWKEESVQYLMDKLYVSERRPPHGCFARDIITTVIDEAEFLGREPLLDEESIDTACTLYLGAEEDSRELAA